MSKVAWPKTSLLLVSGCVMTALLLAVFCLYEYRSFIDRGERLIKTHASVIANDLWQFDVTGVKAYLNLAAEANHYNHFSIEELSGKIFLDVDGPPPSRLDSILINLGIIPVHRFTTDILYQNQKIGVLYGYQYLRFIYPCFTFLIFVLLIMFVTLFIFHLLTSRQVLQQQIREKTREYRASERRFHDLVKLLPEIVWEADTNGLLTFANRIAYERFGYQDPILEKRKIGVSDLLSEEDRERARENYQAVLRGEQVGVNKYNAVTRDGKTFPIHVKSAPIIRDGKITGVRGVIIDLTELHSLEQQLRQAQKMEAIGTLAGGIAHDFNNILTAIIGYIQLVQMETGANSHVASKIDEALKAANRAKDLVHQILTFSRKAEHSKHPLQLSTVVKETVKLLRSSIPVTIEINQKIETSEIVIADATRMHQMIMNLCTNAYQAMEEQGGTLTVILREAEPDQLPRNHTGPDQEKRYVELVISDTGSGIPLEIMDKIFDPYFTTKEKGEGTGLGLSMVHGIVEEHGGFIEVSSRVGHGTSFRIFLPVAEKDKRCINRKKPRGSVVPLGRGETVMIVDDEVQILDLTAEFLNFTGYQVEKYLSAEEAIKAFLNNPSRYDAVITDQTMPHKTGIELCKTIKPVNPECVVILSSGYSTVLTEDALAKAKVDLFLAKPVILNELATRLKELLDQHRKASHA